MNQGVADDQFDEAAFDRKWPADEYEIIETVVKMFLQY
jgi:hypothetical protein